MTLLEQFDTWGEVGCDPNKIRRCIAIAQAVDDMGEGKMPGCCDSVIHRQIMEHADELLKDRA